MLQQKGQNVLLIDRSAAAASGGSGAAGAFVSPKIGKGSSLQEVTNEAYEFSKTFYREHFPDHFHQSGVIRIPKDAEDAEKFKIYEASNTSSFQWLNRDALQNFGIKEEAESFLFDEAGVCDAPALCQAIMAEVAFLQFDVASLRREGELWTLHTSEDQPESKEKKSIYACQETEESVFADAPVLQAKKIVLASGYENRLFDMRYMGVRGTWGSRGDYFSSLPLKVSMHKKISVSANIEGVIKIGASHVKSKTPCHVCDGQPLKGLEKEAAAMVNTEDFVLKETFCGMRAGSKDYFPLAGKVIDVSYMLETYPKILRGAKPPLTYLEGLYVCNGVGGRGFVFSPYIADLLADMMIDGKSMDKRIDPDRLFLKWCRKLNN